MKSMSVVQKKNQKIQANRKFRLGEFINNLEAVSLIVMGFIFFFPSIL